MYFLLKMVNFPASHVSLLEGNSYNDPMNTTSSSLESLLTNQPKQPLISGHLRLKLLQKKATFTELPGKR